MLKRFMILFILLVMLPGTAVLAAANRETPKNQEDHLYQIYPVPQHEVNLDSTFTLTKEIHIVAENGVDKQTLAFVNDILDANKLTHTVSDKVEPDKTNLLLGINDSGGYVDQYFKNNISYTKQTFDKIDPYVLTIDKKLGDQGGIAILGQDTESVYYGLASLNMIMDQMKNRNIHSVTYEDYADTKYRGFIEGFYGFPWSHEERKSLMEFGGKFKMNAYIFGPKDDQYHNSEWRTLYPEKELNKIAELAAVGHETKTHFIWAIHPGFNMIDWNHYDDELETLLNKLEQLYGAGVRQFGLFMDDISIAQAEKNKDKHVKLITDVANWAKDKGDVKSLIYTPPVYNQGWADANGKKYLQSLSNTPKNVEIMWTGSGVVGTVNKEDMAWPKQFTGRDPFVWLNWPVNDYKDGRLMLGKGEVLQKGTHNISGLVSNPMQEAELSKVALFAVADYGWNTDDFNDEQSWLDSFNYIAPDASDALRTIAHHLSDPSPSGHGLVLGESENIKDQLNAFLQAVSDDKKIKVKGQALMAEFDKILQAIENFNENSSNKEMKKEIKPWLGSLHDVLEADKHAVQSAIALQEDKTSSAWEHLAEASSAIADATQYTVKKLNAADVTVEAGAKRLVPFANKLIKQLDSKIYMAADPAAIAAVPVSSYKNQSFSEMTDGDPSTYTYVKTIQGNGDWYGLDLGRTAMVNDIHILQGRNDSDYDIFQRGILEYSKDGKDWKKIGGERSGYKIDESGLQIKARYIRYRLTHAGIPGGKPDLWTAIREFTVNNSHHQTSLYTNVPDLKKEKIHMDGNTAAIQDMQDVTLQPSQYIGMALPALVHIQSIKLKAASNKLQLEVSENGVEWTKVKPDMDKYPDAAYVRIVNATKEDITFDLTRLEIGLQIFSEPKAVHNYPNAYQGEISNIFDGDLASKVWLGGMQDKGKYVQVDLGGVIRVDNAAVVIGDGEQDYFREGDLQLSADGEHWETIHTFSNPKDRSKNFPQHEVPYRMKRVETGGIQARYVRLISTRDHNYWLALNEIIVNEGSALPSNDDLAVHADPKGSLGHEADKLKDGKLATFYQAGKKGSGELHYKLVKNTEPDKLIVLQSPESISNAVIMIRDLDGWHDAGVLDAAYQTVDTAKYKHVLEVKLTWDGTVKPQIHEIIPVSHQESEIKNVAAIKKLADSLFESGEIMSEQALHTLQLHLDAVQHYKKAAKPNKAVKHMRGFAVLLQQQLKQKHLTDTACNQLQKAGDKLIEEWEK